MPLGSDTRAAKAPRGPGRPTGGGRTPDQMRAHLLDAAERVFTRTGALDATVEDIASEAGVSRGTVYRVVNTRDDIIVGVVLRAGRRVVESVQALAQDLADASLFDLVVELTAHVVHLVRAEPGLAAMFSGAGREHAAAIVGEDLSIHDLARGSIDQLLARLSDDQKTQLRPEISLDELAEHLVRIILMLILGESRWSRTPDETRRYLRLFIAPAIVRARGTALDGHRL